MADTSIEWCTKVWNPTTGCDRVSPGCDHCYALTMAKRLKGMGSAKYQRDGDPRTSGPGFGITEHARSLGLPYTWQKPERIFVNSMSDLFHAGVSDGFIAQVWEVMAQCPQHTFMVLTKRHDRMRSWLTRWHDNTGDDTVLGANGLSPLPRGPQAVREAYSSPRAKLFADMLDSMGTPPPGAAYPLYDWAEGPRWYPRPLPNVITVVSVEDQKRAELRIPELLDTPSACRGVSMEPLLGAVDLGGWFQGGCGDCDCDHGCRGVPPGIDWVIVGGESGPGARRMEWDWAASIRDQCAAAGVPFYFKQSGTVLAREWGYVGKGSDPIEWPDWPCNVNAAGWPRQYPQGITA